MKYKHMHVKNDLAAIPSDFLEIMSNTLPGVPTTIC